MAATKTKKRTTAKKPAKKPAKKRTVKRAAKPKGIARAIGSHPFAPGAKVGIFNEAEVAGTRGEPAPEPVVTAKVAKDGSLEARVPKPGSYVAGAETDGGYRRVQFNVVK